MDSISSSAVSLVSISRFFGLVLLLSVFLSPSYHFAPPQFWSSYLSVSNHFHVLITASSSVFRCPITSMFSLLHLPLSFGVQSLPCSHYCIFLCLSVSNHFHVLITASSSIFRCPITSMFSLLHLPLSFGVQSLPCSHYCIFLYLLVSNHFHVLITASSSVFPSSCPNQ